MDAQERYYMEKTAELLRRVERNYGEINRENKSYKEKIGGIIHRLKEMKLSEEIVSILEKSGEEGEEKLGKLIAG